MLCQYVRVMGLGNGQFKQAVANVNVIGQAFDNHIGVGKTQKWGTVPYESHTTFKAHARYFTDRDLVPFKKTPTIL